MDGWKLGSRAYLTHRWFQTSQMGRSTGQSHCHKSPHFDTDIGQNRVLHIVLKDRLKSTTHNTGNIMTDIISILVILKLHTF